MTWNCSSEQSPRIQFEGEITLFCISEHRNPKLDLVVLKIDIYGLTAFGLNNLGLPPTLPQKIESQNFSRHMLVEVLIV